MRLIEFTNDSGYPVAINPEQVRSVQQADEEGCTYVCLGGPEDEAELHHVVKGSYASVLGKLRGNPSQ